MFATIPPTTLDEAVQVLYGVAVGERKATSTVRLSGLAQYCVGELATRGLEGAECEVTIPGGARAKNWDVAWMHNGKARLAISLKSILKNPGGTVPNRIDDLMGEVSNIQMFSPEVVVGYLMLFDASIDKHSPKHGTTWSGLLESRLRELAGRSGPAWGFGMVEGSALLRVDFSEEPKIVSGRSEVENLFDVLVEQVRARNPLAAQES